MNQMLHCSDLKLPEGVEIPELTHGRDTPIVSVHHARAEEVEAPTAGGGAAAAALLRPGTAARRCCSGCGSWRPAPRPRSRRRKPRPRTRRSNRSSRSRRGPPSGAARSFRFRRLHRRVSPHGRHTAADHRRARQSRARAPAHAPQRGLLVRGRARARARRASSGSHARYQGEIARVTLEGRELVLLKPQTYMNRSGLSIRALVDYMKAPVAELLVVHDELDLPPGMARLKFGGGHGGHNGLRDIDHALRRRISGACASASATRATSRRGHRLRAAARAAGRRGGDRRGRSMRRSRRCRVFLRDGAETRDAASCTPQGSE